ncbi:DUF3120 domain-containing protein [Thalassoporum mexicanum]|uniref:DUF3120 domain-containing protein n=1 Tax=Thalassoporum mexicanum TaxID=3457544 RepID=UPI0018DC2697|nr:DUF3120 domain-containing protein [Pseudanabaena sp. PCC 7367]
MFTYLSNTYKNKLASADWSQYMAIWLGAAFLVSVPVFFQAPLVRQAPWISLILTVGWLSLSRQWLEDESRHHWGSIMWGFSLTWFCGSIYWSWLRWEPLWHLPIEAIALPWAIWAIFKRQNSYLVGAWFYLGSLVGTGITDIYFYLTDVVPQWRELMQLESNVEMVRPLLQSAIAQIQTPWGMIWMMLLALWIMAIGIRAMASKQIHHWAFSGALLCTLVVDSLFGISAVLLN